MIKDKTKGLITLAYLIVSLVFLCIGDAYDPSWFTVFFENEHILAAVLLYFVWRQLKSTTWKHVFEVAMVWKLFYIVFNIVIIFEPFSSYKDFTSNPVVCTQILWCVVGFAIIQKFRK